MRCRGACAGGKQRSATALAIHMETYMMHITALPMAVSLQCLSARTKHAVL